MEASYTAAGALPLKVVLNEELMRYIRTGTIPPIHIQLMPTNRCNLACSFCSCEYRDRTAEMPIEEIVSLAERFVRKGTQSVTITGGGEPLVHPHFDEMVDAFYTRGIEVGLVTNGLLLHKVSHDTLDKLTWCRISASDERDIPDIAEAVTAPIDWAFSYVLSKEPDIHNLGKHFRFAEKHGFTHVRVVSDLTDIEHSPMALVRNLVDSPLAIWQDRQEFTHGAQTCLISQLKPVISAEGWVYPCCGVQYARDDERTMPEDMSMGHWSDYGGFDGSECVRCYYDAYNTLLAGLTSEMHHLTFV